MKCWTYTAAHLSAETWLLHGLLAVEADDGRVEPDVGFGQAVAEVVGVGMFGEVVFGAVEGLEQLCHGLFVGFLCAVVVVS